MIPQKVPLDDGLSHILTTLIKEKKQSLLNYLSLDLNSAFYENILFSFKYTEFSRNLITI